jgi:TonB family protein
MKFGAVAAFSICVSLFAQRPSSEVQEPQRDRVVSEITVERQGCYGGCPIYTLTLRRQGVSTYIGKSAPRRGLYLGNVSRVGDFDQLSRAISYLRFFELPDEVGTAVIDAQAVVVKVTTPSQLKMVKTFDLARAPSAFWTVVMLADAMAANVSWQNPNEPKNGILGPVPLNKVEPRYTEQALKARLEGSVILQVGVRNDGTVAPDNVDVVQGLGLGLDEQAIEAVKQWMFKPAYKDGKPIGGTMAVTVQVEFRL